MKPPYPYHRQGRSRNDSRKLGGFLPELLLIILVMFLPGAFLHACNKEAAFREELNKHRAAQHYNQP